MLSGICGPKTEDMKAKIGNTCSTHGDIRSANKIVLGKTEGRSQSLM
jgi:hypothetical protein